MDRAVEESQLHGGEVDRKNDIKRVGKSALGNNFKFPQQIRSKNYSDCKTPSNLAHDYFVLRPDDEKQHDIAGLNKCWWLSSEEFGDPDALFHESADWSTENKAHKDVIAAAIDHKQYLTSSPCPIHSSYPS